MSFITIFFLSSSHINNELNFLIIKKFLIRKYFPKKILKIMLILLYFFVNILIENKFYTEYNECIKRKEKFI